MDRRSSILEFMHTIGARLLNIVFPFFVFVFNFLSMKCIIFIYIYIIGNKRIYAASTWARGTTKDTWCIHLSPKQASKRTREGKQTPSTYFELIQSTKPIIVKQWSSIYSLTHSTKELINGSLIACIWFFQVFKRPFVYFLPHRQKHTKELLYKLFSNFLLIKDPHQLNKVPRNDEWNTHTTPNKE